MLCPEFYKKTKVDFKMNENALIFGDSYSTFEGWMPLGYATYYNPEDTFKSGVSDVSETWWHQVVTEANLNLVLNNSWSGSTIGHTGYDNLDCSNSSSFIYRLRKLIDEGFFEENKIDTVFVFGGTNDSWSNAPLGEEKLSDWEEKDLFCVLPAIGYFFEFLRETLPDSEIYCIINTEIKEEIAACLKEASERNSIATVTFETIDKVNGHPTLQGMKDIKNAVLKAMGK